MLSSLYAHPKAWLEVIQIDLFPTNCDLLGGELKCAYFVSTRFSDKLSLLRPDKYEKNEGSNLVSFLLLRSSKGLHGI